MAVEPIYGCRLLVVTPLDTTTFEPEAGGEHHLEVPQEASAEPDIEEGARNSLRGGDRLVGIIEEEDYLLGMNITFNNAELTPEALQIIAGAGSLIEEETEVVGYELPTFDDQHDGRTPFQTQLYVARFAEGFNEREEVIGFYEFTFPFCKGRVPSISAAGQTFMVPSFTLEARENKHTTPKQGAFKFQAIGVDDLPEE